ncbi:TRAP transporter small permease subunit [Faunimonas sp. B44]|uniref:TRAP transporter small permease subunit n=1 Tax=Faunimonas sp. B44 TaxID=3461493 RepID=UPI0040446DD4
MHTYVRVVSALSRAAGLVSVGLLVAALLVVCQMVAMRYFLRASTVWQTEFVVYSIVAATFLGSSYVLLQKGHVNVDLLPNALGTRGRVALEALSGFLSLVFCALLAWSGWVHFEEAWSRNWTTATVWALPLWIPLLPLPLGIGLLSLQYVAELIKLRDELR